MNQWCAHDRWEAAEPGRAGRAALLWTQKQAAKVAETRDGVAPGAAATDGVGGGGAGGGDEEWIKARAAAVGVPMELEKDRQAR